jgi:hypothetical protein
MRSTNVDEVPEGKVRVSSISVIETMMNAGRTQRVVGHRLCAHLIRIPDQDVANAFGDAVEIAKGLFDEKDSRLPNYSTWQKHYFKVACEALERGDLIPVYVPEGMSVAERLLQGY